MFVNIRNETVLTLLLMFVMRCDVCYKCNLQYSLCLVIEQRLLSSRNLIQLMYISFSDPDILILSM